MSHGWIECFRLSIWKAGKKSCSGPAVIMSVPCIAEKMGEVENQPLLMLYFTCRFQPRLLEDFFDFRISAGRILNAFRGFFDFGLKGGLQRLGELGSFRVVYGVGGVESNLVQGVGV